VLDGDAEMGTHAGRRRGCLEQHAIEVASSLATAKRWLPLERREWRRRDELTSVVAHAAEGLTPNLVRETQARERGHSRRHDSLTAGLVARDRASLEELHPETGTAEQDRERRASDPAARDQDVGHGRKRGLWPIARA
jgi:hypothetical protein